MGIREAILLAWTSLRINTLRSTLTLLGVIIGIMSVIAISMLGDALRLRTLHDVEALGMADFQLTVEERPTQATNADDFALGAKVATADLLTETDLDVLRTGLGERIRGVSAYGPTLEETTLTLAGAATEATVLGINEDFTAVNNVTFLAGRSVLAADIAAGERVLAVPEEALPPGLDPQAALGLPITVDVAGTTVAFEVIGVTRAPQIAGGLVNPNPRPRAYVPYTALGGILGVPPRFQSVGITLSRDADPDATYADLLRLADALYAGNPYAQATVHDYTANFERIEGIVTVITWVMSAIAAIALLVAGIGVMNIMLVSVTERTREIGVRKALGATQGAIATQFVIEAMVICAVGGLIGVVAGIAIGFTAAAVMGVTIGMPWLQSVIAVGFSAVIGLLFGTYPAVKAGKLDPIVALRYE